MKITSYKTATHYQWGELCDGWHLLNTDQLSVIQERVPPGCGEHMHYHRRAQQFFFVLAGQARLDIDGEIHVLHAQQGISVPAKLPHRLSNESDQELSFLVISAPHSHGDRITVE